MTRHIRVPRLVDVGIRRAALEERRGYNQLVVLIVEDWLAARAQAEAARELPEAPLPPRRRQPRKAPRKA